MTELSLQPWNKRPYGWIARGHAGGVPVCIRSPRCELDDDNLPKIVNFNGLAAGRESMAVAARTAVHGLGYAAITFDYTNTGSDNPLQRNADDGLRVIDALPAGDISLMGLSMGGAVSTKVASQTDRPIQTLHLVAPAAYTKGLDELSWQAVAQAFGEEYIDTAQTCIKQPYRSYLVASHSLRNCMSRPWAVSAELNELRQTSAYDDLRQFRSAQPDSTVVLAHGSNDRLIPRKPLLDSITDEEAATGSPLVDHQVPYPGSHTQLAFDPKLTLVTLTANHPEVSRRLAA